MQQQHYAILYNILTTVWSYTPVWTGTLKNGIGYSGHTAEFSNPILSDSPPRDGEGFQWWVHRYQTWTSAISPGYDPLSPNGYAMPVEFGSVPHSPPISTDGMTDTIWLWAVTHNIVPWNLQKHVARFGTPARLMFIKTFAEVPGIIASSGSYVPRTMWQVIRTELKLESGQY
jgi:hypothetical protein